MTRQVTALVFLSRLALFAQPQQSPTFSKADMIRLLEDMKKVLIANTKSRTQILAKQYNEEMQKAAKAPTTAERTAAMQKATDDYKKRVDALNRGGQPSLASAIALIQNPPHPENGFYGNLLNACMTGNTFLTRTEDGTPVLQQVTVEEGTAILHTVPLGLSVEKTAPSHLSLDALCPTLVKNAVRPSPPTLAQASTASDSRGPCSSAPPAPRLPGGTAASR
jgi:hypothetical protein